MPRALEPLIYAIDRNASVWLEGTSLNASFDSMDDVDSGLT